MGSAEETKNTNIILMKKIIIEVGEIKSVGDVSFPDIIVKTEGEFQLDELTGVLRVAYQQQVEKFLEQHECNDCPAYLLHSRSQESLDAVARGIQFGV